MSKFHYAKIATVVVSCFFLLQCTHKATFTNTHLEPERSITAVDATNSNATASTTKDALTPYWLDSVPGNSKDFYEQIKRSLFSNKKNKLTAEQIQIATRYISQYASFIMYNYPNSLEKKKVADKFINRLFQSSTQFILCRNLQDYACIESTPHIVPTSDFRIEDPSLKLGEMVRINDSLDKNLEWYLNEQIFLSEDEYQADIGVARILEDKIRNVSSTKDNSIFMALYGVDDIAQGGKGRGSLGGVYGALLDKINSKTPVYGVFDIKNTQTQAPRPLIMSYVKPKDESEQQNWILSPYQLRVTPIEKTNIDFQYNGGTQGLIHAMNHNVQDNAEARARLEWKNNGIMHNKFFIFKEKNDWSVWTGTANISRTCLGTERNSNLSIFIKNNEIAKSYFDEFMEMFTFQDPTPENTDLNPPLIGSNKNKNFPYGKFHTAKRPNSKRLFYFEKDKSFVRVYFSPTDDAEHRAIIPLILSAKPGDKLLISMYGGAGIEYVRAMQFAAARGVDVKVLVDSPTSCSAGSWAGRSGDATLLEKNPYRTLFKNSIKPIEVRKNDKNVGMTWKQNHQKVGLLLRQQANGEYLPTDLIVGSQNWSNSGNDINDENLITFTNTDRGLKIGYDFEKHFETFLWPKSQLVAETGCAELSQAKTGTATDTVTDEPID